MSAVATTPSVLAKKQRKFFGPRTYQDHGTTYRVKAKVRYDDECGNGHNTFSITGDIDREVKTGQWYEAGGGCCHDEIAKLFPELAPLIKWHMCSSDGPMHYAANVLYLAGNKDCYGFRKGEAERYEYGVRFGDSPVTHHIEQSFWKFLQERQGTGDFQIIEIEHGPNANNYKFKPRYTFAGYGIECAFDSKIEAEEWAAGFKNCKIEFVKRPAAFSDGKERELELARKAAIWPEATKEELCADDLKERLEARLPQLLADFRAAVESLGFVW